MVNLYLQLPQRRLSEVRWQRFLYNGKILCKHQRRHCESIVLSAVLCSTLELMCSRTCSSICNRAATPSHYSASCDDSSWLLAFYFCLPMVTVTIGFSLAIASFTFRSSHRPAILSYVDVDHQSKMYKPKKHLYFVLPRQAREKA